MLNELPNSGQAVERVDNFSDVFLGHREGVVVVFEVFLDESGTHHDSQVVSVAAVWADKSEWSAWTLDWINAKAPVRVNHAVDCHNRVGEYAGWSRAKRDKYVIDILSVIKNHYIRGTIAAVDKQEIISALKKKHGISINQSEMVKGWYFVCLVWAIREAWESLNKAGHNNIAFVHEQNQYSHEAQEAFLMVEKRMNTHSASFSIGSKMAYMPLQCADILAYEGNHQMRNFSQPLRKPLEAIDPTLSRFHFKKYDKSEVGEIVEFTARNFPLFESQLLKPNG